MALTQHDAEGTGLARIHEVERHFWFDPDSTGPSMFVEGWHCTLGCDQLTPGWERRDLAWALRHVVANQWTE